MKLFFALVLHSFMSTNYFCSSLKHALNVFLNEPWMPSSTLPGNIVVLVLCSVFTEDSEDSEDYFSSANK